MNWFVIIALAVIAFFLVSWIRGAGTRRKAPNILGDDGWPKPENRGGARPNDEE